MHRENDKRHLFRDARVAIGEKRETRKKKKRKKIIHIYIYTYIYILSQKRCKIGPNIKMNGLSYSHESKQKVCGTTFPVNHLYVCYRRHIHTLLCRTLSPTRRLISFLVYFLVCERCRTFYLYGSMWLFSSHEFYKKNRKKKRLAAVESSSDIFSLRVRFPTAQRVHSPPWRGRASNAWTRRTVAVVPKRSTKKSK